MPALAPPSMDMLQTVILPSMDRERTASPVYSTTCPCPPPIPICPMMPRMRSFAVTPKGSAAVDPDLHRGRLALADGLRCKDVLDLRCADAECKRTECAVRGRVTVAAHDDLAGLGPSLLGADDVDNALVWTRHIEQVYVELLAVALKGVELLLCNGVSDRQRDAARVGRGVVVDDGDGEVGASDSPARLS